ncbi:Hsp20/alpha crystallin family protein [Candidatus Peregrinibacteria bacterium]|nr:Hsp20/alpha crystallin family protein [Candidatus Peregrinibacteria bacterium]
MGIFKKSTPQKSQTKVVPDEKDVLSTFINEEKNEEPKQEEGQLALDVFQTADEIVVVAPVAGVAKNDISINVTDDVLTIKGSRNFQFKTEQADYFTQECFWGNFSRSIILPEAVDVSQVEASFKNGILTVKIPKVERIKTRMVKIKEE